MHVFTMANSNFGQVFRITVFGESHGPAVGVVVDGCPAGLSLDASDVQQELDRRRPGAHRLTTQRQEKDTVEILSGVFEGTTLGSPITMMVRNTDADAKYYEPIKNFYRPGHADYPYEVKYGVRDWRGGGRASARTTVGHVAGGAVAKKLLNTINVHVVGYVVEIGTQKVSTIDETVVNENILHCPDPMAIDRLVAEIETARRDGDSVGGVVQVVAHGVPAGWGEPIFHKFSADLAHACMSIPAVKGFEIGDGFAVTKRRGSENNDAWVKRGDGSVGTKTNSAGGIIGGISTGEDIVVRFALKPASSIVKEQQTVDRDGKLQSIRVHGRHDPCVAPRAVPIGEAMMAIVLADHYLLSRTNRL